VDKGEGKEGEKERERKKEGETNGNETEWTGNVREPGIVRGGADRQADGSLLP